MNSRSTVGAIVKQSNKVWYIVYITVVSEHINVAPGQDDYLSKQNVCLFRATAPSDLFHD